MNISSTSLKGSKPSFASLATSVPLMPDWPNKERHKAPMSLHHIILDGIYRGLSDSEISAETLHLADAPMIGMYRHSVHESYIASVETPDAYKRNVGRELANAIASDEELGRYNMASGMFGPNMSKVIFRFAKLVWITNFKNV